MSEFKIRNFVLGFVRKHLLLTILLLVSVLFSALISLVPPLLLRYLLDQYLTPLLASQAVDSSGILLAVLYFLSYFLVGFGDIFQNLMMSFFGQKLVHSLRYQMIEKSHRLKTSFFASHGTGEMQSRIMDDVSAVETLFASGLFSMLVSAFKVIGILISLFLFSVYLGWIILAVIPIIFVLTLSFRKSMLKAQIENRKLVNHQLNLVTESMDSLRSIQNLDQEEYKENEYKGLLEKSYRMRNRTAIFDSTYSPILEVLKSLLIVAVTYLVLYSIGNDDSAIFGFTVGTFAASLNFISDIFTPIENIGMELEAMQEGASGMKRVQAYMNEEEEMPKDDSLTSERIFARENVLLLEAKDLTFRYEDGDKDIFHKANFAIRTKEKVTLVGRTGVGKTTLFRLILGLYSPTDGSLLLNGYDVSKIPHEQKRKIFGYVEQGFSAAEGTIKDQITLYDDSISLEKVRDVMKQVGLDSYVTAKIPHGYDERFQESLFSRGQLQLLSLARALVTQPKILLLDEISANLDSKTEKQIIDTLASVSSDRTILSISHRLSDQLGFDKTMEIS